MKKMIALVMAVACLALAVPGAALAQSPTADGYSGIAGQQDSSSNSPGTSSDVPVAAEVEAVAEESVPAEATTAGSTLPFTGLEVGAIALIGVLMLGGGVVLYRISHRPGQLS